MSSQLPRITRDQLRKVFPDDRSLREFEKVLNKIQDIIDNTSDITTLFSDVSTNTSNIATNASNIATKVSKTGDTMTGQLKGITPVSNEDFTRKDYVDGNDIGIGQTWQNVIGSRAASTTYQNTTSKPIYVAIGATGTTVPVEVSADAVTWIQVGATGSSSSNTFVVPKDYRYRINGSTTISYWAELR